jgi:hypothetical protein
VNEFSDGTRVLIGRDFDSGKMMGNRREKLGRCGKR